MGKFSDSYRASAVVMLQSEGYPDDPFAVGRVHEYLKQSSPCPTKTSLKNWFVGASNPPPSKILDDKKRDMADEFKELIWLLVDHAKTPDTISDMSGQQAITSVGILVDKMRLLMGLPTQIVGIIPDVVTALERAGENPELVFKRLIETANKRADERTN
jgi:hypothetical protein